MKDKGKEPPYSKEYGSYTEVLRGVGLRVIWLYFYCYYELQERVRGCWTFVANFGRDKWSAMDAMHERAQVCMCV